MKPAPIIFGALIGLIVLLLLTAGIFNFKNDRKPEAQEFLSGKAPGPALDGSYKGTQFSGLGKLWRGKSFNSTENTGINDFSSESDTNKLEQRYPFKTSQTSGLRNRDQSVMQLNYNTANNPLWMKLIKDEVVEVSPRNYLGKIQLKIGFAVITLGYFRLSN